MPPCAALLSAPSLWLTAAPAAPSPSSPPQLHRGTCICKAALSGEFGYLEIRSLRYPCSGQPCQIMGGKKLQLCLCLRGVHNMASPSLGQVTATSLGPSLLTRELQSSLHLQERRAGSIAALTGSHTYTPWWSTANWARAGALRYYPQSVIPETPYSVRLGSLREHSLCVSGSFL